MAQTFEPPAEMEKEPDRSFIYCLPNIEKSPKVWGVPVRGWKMSRNPTLSIVVPMHNEADSAAPLVAEIAAATAGLPVIEIICIDDGSTDDTRARLKAIKSSFPALRVLVHPRKSGQSAGIVTGVRAATSDLVATLDGDGQNDPADIPCLYESFIKETSDHEANREPRRPVLVAGQRAIRRDNAIRRLSSRLANGIRSSLLGDGVRDTGCGLKLFARADFLNLPAFNHMHRYLPALYVREGGRTVLVSVGHRPRSKGTSKYGFWDRLWVGISDLAGVLWLLRRPASVQDVHEDSLDVQPSVHQKKDSRHAALA